MLCESSYKAVYTWQSVSRKPGSADLKITWMMRQVLVSVQFEGNLCSHAQGMLTHLLTHLLCLPE